MDEMTPEQIEMLLATIGDPAKLQDLEDQLKQAEALRNYSADPTMQAGRLVIPNYQGAVETFINRREGNKQAPRVRAERDGIMANQASRSRDFLAALTRGRPPAPVEPPPPMEGFNPGGY